MDLVKSVSSSFSARTDVGRVSHMKHWHRFPRKEQVHPGLARREPDAVFSGLPIEHQTLSIILCLEPHLVGHSVMSECSGRLCSCCAFFSAVFCFQLWEKCPTNFLQSPAAQSMRLSSLTAFSEKKMWNKLLQTIQTSSNHCGQLII